MCFKIDKEKCPLAVKAKKDIRVYKLLEYFPSFGGLKTPFQYYKYTPKEICQADFYISSSQIHQGFHAYISKKGIKKAINDGYYWRSCICEFIIPKGSKYYFNDEEIVSDKTYWTGRVYRTDRWVKWNKKLYVRSRRLTKNVDIQENKIFKNKK